MQIDLDARATQSQIAGIVGVSQPLISDVESRGVCTRDMSLGVWLRSYMMHLREQAAGRAAAGDLDLASERAMLAREQRVRIEMQNAVTRGELAPVILIEEVLTQAASKVAGLLDAIPGMVRRRVPQLTGDEIDMIAGEVAKARNAVASMSMADLRDEDDALADPSVGVVEIPD